MWFGWCSLARSRLILRSQKLGMTIDGMRELLGELQAGDGARNYVLLNLYQIGVRERHPENCVYARAVRNVNHNAGPIARVHAAAKMPLRRRDSRNHYLLLALRPEIIHDAVQPLFRRSDVDRQRFPVRCLSDQ